MKVILVIDQGTSSSRVLLVNNKTEVVFTYSKSIKQIFPAPSFIEQDPEEIWQTVVESIKEAIKYADNKGYEIISSSITNQRETTIIWHKKTGIPIYNAISWQDNRTAKYCKKFDECEKKYIQQKTGLILNPYFSASKINWLIKNKLQNQDLAEYAFGTIDSFLIYRLNESKLHLTDRSNASRTLLFDIEKSKYDNKLLELFEIDYSILPQVKNSIDDFGSLNKEIFGKEIPISAVIGDQQAATIGHCCFKENMAKATFGTGCFLMANSGENFTISNNNLLTTILYSEKNKNIYALEGSVFYAGSAIKWAKENMGFFDDFKDVEKDLYALKDNGGVYCVPALSGLGAPYWNDKAKGIIIGLTSDNTKNHLTRAVFESVAYQTYDLINIMKSDGIVIDELNIDGGMVENNWFNQFLSNVLGVILHKKHTSELTSLGAAYLAGLNIGLFKDLNEITSLHKITKTYKIKNFSNNLREELIANWQKSIKACINLAK